MRIRAATLALAAALAAGTAGCELRRSLAAPPSGFRTTLAGLLATAPLDPPPPGAPVLTFIYALPDAGSAKAPLDIRIPPSAKLPPWTTIHPKTGVDALSERGLYVGVLSISAGTIRYLVRVGDPRNVRGEVFDPAGRAVLLRAGGGSYSVRLPFVVDGTAVSFESDGQSNVTRVHYYFPFGGAVPGTWGRRFMAVHD